MQECVSMDYRKTQRRREYLYFRSYRDAFADGGSRRAERKRIRGIGKMAPERRTEAGKAEAFLSRLRQVPPVTAAGYRIYRSVPDKVCAVRYR